MAATVAEDMLVCTSTMASTAITDIITTTMGIAMVQASTTTAVTTTVAIAVTRISSGCSRVAAIGSKGTTTVAADREVERSPRELHAPGVMTPDVQGRLFPRRLRSSQLPATTVPALAGRYLNQ